MDKPILSRKQAAEYLGRQPQTLAKWASQGVGPKYIRPRGGKVIYRRADIDDWLARQSGHMCKTHNQALSVNPLGTGSAIHPQAKG